MKGNKTRRGKEGYKAGRREKKNGSFLDLQVVVVVVVPRQVQKVKNKQKIKSCLEEMNFWQRLPPPRRKLAKTE